MILYRGVRPEHLHTCGPSPHPHFMDHWEQALWTEHMWPGNMGSLWAIHLCCQWGKRKVGSLVCTLISWLLSWELSERRPTRAERRILLPTRFRPWNVLTQEPREWPHSNEGPASLTWGGALQIGRGRKGDQNSFPHGLNTMASAPLIGLSASPLHRVARSQGRRQGSSASGLPRTRLLKTRIETGCLPQTETSAKGSQAFY